MSKKKQRNKEKRNTDKRAEKKAIVLGTEKKSRLPLIITCLIIGVLLIGSGIFFIGRKESKISPVASVETAKITSTTVSYPADLFENGKARHFSYKAGDSITINYFILKSSDGIIRAAFDACDVCWPAGKGYYQSGDVMVCRNCGRKFASVLVNEVKGGCNPAPLNREVVDGRVVIQISDIMEGVQFFDFSRRS